jgi:hypothetical protein
MPWYVLLIPIALGAVLLFGAGSLAKKLGASSQHILPLFKIIGGSLIVGTLVAYCAVQIQSKVEGFAGKDSWYMASKEKCTPLPDLDPSLNTPEDLIEKSGCKEVVPEKNNRRDLFRRMDCGGKFSSDETLTIIKGRLVCETVIRTAKEPEKSQ